MTPPPRALPLLAPLLLAALACGSPTDPGLIVGFSASIALGDDHSCAVGADTTARCWGWGRLGQLGTGDTLNQSVPRTVLGRLRLVAISAGTNHTCGLTRDGRAHCWGSAFEGELGNGSSVGRVTAPAPVLGGLEFKQISAGDGHSCGVTVDGVAYCWGKGDGGALGTGGVASASAPATVSTSLRFGSVSAGLFYSCGVTTTQNVYCWGDNARGQLGIGTVGGSSLIPVPVVGDLRFAAVSAGQFFTCAVATDGAGHCWGSSSFGRLGTGINEDGVQPQPMPVAGGLGFRQIQVGVDHSCGVTTTGSAYCWGLNTYGKLGSVAGPVSFEPVPVSGGLVFTGVSAGLSHSCGLTTDGRGYCWGRNSVGQLGRNGVAQSTSPIQILP